MCNLIDGRKCIDKPLKPESLATQYKTLFLYLGVQDTGPGVELTEDVQIQLIWVLQLEPNPFIKQTQQKNQRNIKCMLG